jgi:ketosteroid isomerase-like protein
MSANLDLVRSILAAWERGDYSWTEWAHPEIEYVFADGPDPGTGKGLAGMVEAVSGRLGPWEDFRCTADEYRELDGERVLVLVNCSGRGKTSGIDITQFRAEEAFLLHVHRGKVTRLVRYFDREHALADLGLKE